jgi:hypothetical protein
MISTRSSKLAPVKQYGESEITKLLAAGEERFYLVQDTAPT